MPEKRTIERAEQDAREGKSPTTQAGEFVREEIHHVREGKHGGAFGQAGHRDRAVEGAARRGETAPSTEGNGVRRRPTPRLEGPGQGSEHRGGTVVTKAVPRRPRGTRARRSFGRVAASPGQSGARRVRVGGPAPSAPHRPGRRSARRAPRLGPPRPGRPHEPGPSSLGEARPPRREPTGAPGVPA